MSSSSAVIFLLLREKRRLCAPTILFPSDASSLTVLAMASAKSSSDSSHLTWITACTRRISVEWEATGVWGLLVAARGELLALVFRFFDELRFGCGTTADVCSASSESDVLASGASLWRVDPWFVCLLLWAELIVCGSVVECLRVNKVVSIGRVYCRNR